MQSVSHTNSKEGNEKVFSTRKMDPNHGHPCPYCNKICKSERGLTQHIINRTKECYQRRLDEITSDPNPAAKRPNPDASYEIDSTTTQGWTSIGGRRKFRKLARENETKADGNDSKTGLEKEDTLDEEIGYPVVESKMLDSDPCMAGGDTDASGSSTHPSDEETKADGTGKATGVDATMLEGFVEYCSTHEKKFVDLSAQERTSIRLMDLLKTNKTPLNAYPEFLEWHLKETGELQEDETLKDTKQWCGSRALLKRMIPRYNLQAMLEF